MRVLIVGAGAVGQVYAHALQLGGAEVAVLVKPKHAAECGRGFVLYPLNRPKNIRHSPIRFQVSEVLTTSAEVAARKWDSVILCIPTTGLRGPWFEELARSIGEASLVSMVPGADTRDYLLKFVPEARLVFGVITLISYPAPLPGESVPVPGTAFWTPPFSSIPMHGPQGRVEAMVKAFRAGGLAAKNVSGPSDALGFADGVLGVFVAALKHFDWKFKTLTEPANLDLFLRANHESKTIVAWRLKQKPPAFFALLSAPVLRAIVTVGPKFFPFDMEAYLQIHFTKVGEQMREGLHALIEEGKSAGLPVAALQQLAKE